MLNSLYFFFKIFKEVIPIEPVDPKIAILFFSWKYFKIIQNISD